MATAREELTNAMSKLDAAAPALTKAMETALEELRRTPRTVEERRDLDGRLAAIGAAWEGVRDALVLVSRMSAEARDEYQAAVSEAIALRHTVASLEGQLALWQREYEPDAFSSRPAFFSNLRQALATFLR